MTQDQCVTYLIGLAIVGGRQEQVAAAVDSYLVIFSGTAVNARRAELAETFRAKAPDSERARLIYGWISDPKPTSPAA